LTAYSSSPFTPVVALIPGSIRFSYGKRNDRTPPTRMSIQSVAITSNVATLAVTIIDGAIPIVGALASIQGTQTATSGGGSNFNLTNVSITGVSISTTTGIGTITFALTSTNIATTTDGGQVVVPQTIIKDTLPGTAAAGQQFAIQSMTAGNKQHGLSWFTQYTGSPASVTAQLQIADIDEDANYTTIDTSTATSGETRSVGNVTANFVRIRMASTGGTSPTCAAGVVLS
jgi:hypothetical protein